MAFPESWMPGHLPEPMRIAVLSFETAQKTGRHELQALPACGLPDAERALACLIASFLKELDSPAWMPLPFPPSPGPAAHKNRKPPQSSLQSLLAELEKREIERGSCCSGSPSAPPRI